MISYLVHDAWASVMGNSKPSRSQPSNQAGTWTGIATIASLVVLACSCCCLCAGGAAYVSYEFNRLANGGMSLAGKPKDDRPVVGSSRMKARHGEGSSKRFLTQAEIRGHLERIAAQKKQENITFDLTGDSSSGEEEQAATASQAFRNSLM